MSRRNRCSFFTSQEQRVLSFPHKIFDRVRKMENLNSIRIPLTMIMLLILNGCATMSNGKSWGEDATFSPGWDKVEKAAYNSLVSPLTWGPATGAAILQISDWDRHLSNWASDKRPIFGSRTNARDWSNYLLYSTGALYTATALLTPSGDRTGEWMTNKMKGFIVGGAALGLSEGVTETLKPSIRRLRPDASSSDSFPSGHATAAASLATLASKNMEAMHLSKSGEIICDTGLGLIAAGTGWARIEADLHYPSDVLAGIAIGHFISSFVNEAFLGNDNSDGFSPEADISRDGFRLNLAWHY